MDWLGDFERYTKDGEAPLKMLRWVGVSTIAACLQRKVFIPMRTFQWTPNFYILLVGVPGLVKKSTAMWVGNDLLKRAGVSLGPQSITWQRLIQKMSEEHSSHVVNGQEFTHSSITLPISEFGTFFKKEDQGMVDALTELWDGKLGAFQKETKGNGSEDVENPWINIIAGTTPDWVAENFPAKLIGSGFGSRPIFVYAEEPNKSVAYPDEVGPAEEEWEAMQASLVEDLRVFAEYSGAMSITQEARAWGRAWYEDWQKEQLRLGKSLEASFGVRLQTHLHKLAMVISCSDGDFPVVNEVHLQKANAMLQDLRADAKEIFSAVGQSPITTAAAEIEKILARGAMRRTTLYREFAKRMDIDQFMLAVKSAIASGGVIEVGDLANPMLELNK